MRFEEHTVVVIRYWGHNVVVKRNFIAVLYVMVFLYFSLFSALCC